MIKLAAKLESVSAAKVYEKNGISFFHIKSEKFKTVRIDVFFIEPLNKEKASSNAIIPFVLKRGSESYPDQQKLAMRLEELYGAGLSANVMKKGENQIIHFNADFVSDQYTAGKTKLFDEIGNLVIEIITKPALENGSFNSNYFEQEKGNLIQRIKSRVNDKVHYSLLRCMEEMCKDELFAVYEDGDEESAKALTREKVYEDYAALLRESPVYVYISGIVSDSEIKTFVDKFDSIRRNNIKSIVVPNVKKDIPEVRRIEEPMDISQGKLCLGFRTQTEANSPDYYPLAIYNGILGGGVQSKLFQNVREKESMAYFAFSRLEKFKGLMVVCSGIDISNREKAEKVIAEQLTAIRNGDISDFEMDATKKTFETGIKSMQDSQGAMVDFFLSQHISNINENIDTFLERLLEVSKQDVVRISERITPDTVYFLTSLSEENS
jgi:predicted Zn-dependent peptidase